MTTISAFPTRSFTDFQIGAGRPSPTRTLTRTEVLDNEKSLVETLRHYTTGMAQHCQHDTPSEYAEFVEDLIGVGSDECPTSGEARLSGLLHLYAEYMPSTECAFMSMSSAEYHAWRSPDGMVIVDLVTTLALTELDPGEAIKHVTEAQSDANWRWDGLFAGLRLIVLDSPYESTWYPAAGEPQPLLMSDINPVLTDGGFGDGEWL